MGHRGGIEPIRPIVESVSDPIVVLEAADTVTVWNDAARELFGYAAVEAVGESLVELLSVHGVHRRRLESLLGLSGSSEADGSWTSVRLTATHATGSPVRIELERIASDPHVLLASPIEEPTSTPSSPVSVDTSVYRLAIERSTDLIAAIDQQERLLIANDRYRTVHQLDEPVIGVPLEEVLSPELYAEVKPHLETALDGETVQYETERTGPEGTNHFFDVHYYPLESRQGRIQGVVMTMRELTGLKRQAESLRNAWETYRELVQAIPHPLVLHEKNGEIIEVNDAACRVFESRERDLLRKNLRSLLTTDRADRPFARLERGDSDEEFFETTFQTVTGEQIPVDVAATLVEHFGREAILTLARVITE